MHRFPLSALYILVTALMAGYVQAQDAPPAAEPETKKLYKLVKPSGEVIYSDQPMPGAKEIEAPSGGTNVVAPVETPQFRAFDPGRKPKGNGAQPYTSFEITSPANDTTMWAEASGDVTVTASLSPGLRSNHSLFFMFDGNPYEREDLTITFQNVDRGSHVIRAEIRDQNGQVVQSTPDVTIHVKRPTINRK